MFVFDSVMMGKCLYPAQFNKADVGSMVKEKGYSLEEHPTFSTAEKVPVTPCVHQF